MKLSASKQMAVGDQTETQDEGGPASQPCASTDALKKIAKCFGVTTDWLLFEDSERGPDEDLRLQFEAMGQLSPEEKNVARAVLEGLLLKHAAHRFSAASNTPGTTP